MNADRLVLPIPPGTHWSEAKPIILPGAPSEPCLPKPRVRANPKAVVTSPPAKQSAMINSGGLRFGALPAAAAPVTKSKVKTPPPDEKPEPTPKVKGKNDPKLVAAARELRDRYLEQVNHGGAPLLPERARYDVSRRLPRDQAGIQALEISVAIPALPRPIAA